MSDPKWTLGLAAALVTGCNAIYGIEELPVKKDAGAEGGGGTGGGTSSTTSGSTSTTSGSTSTTSDTGITISCPPGQATCGGGLTCIDLVTDRHNCGACGHDCLDGLCAGAKCQPFQIQGGLEYPQDVAVHDSFVYFVTFQSGDVWQLTLDGTVGTLLATGQTHAMSVAVSADGGTVFFGTFDGVLRSVPADEGPVTTIATGQGPLVAVAADASFVYWVNGAAAMKSPIAGAAPAIIAQLQPEQGPASGIALDATTMYWTRSINPGGLYRAPLGGGAPSAFSTMEAFPNAVEVAGGDVYWVDGGPGAASGAVKKMPLGGSSMAETLASGSDNPVRVAVDSAHVYWTAKGGSAVMRVPRAGGAAEVVAGNQNHAYGLAVDATSIVWSNAGTDFGSGDGAVMRLAK